MSDGEPMSAQPHTYAVADPETALKYVIRHIQVDRVQIVEGASPRHAVLGP
jgi:hypothetical protein